MFSWSKHKTTAYPGGRSGTGSREGSRISRSDHLQSYLEDVILKPSTRGVSKDDTTYDTVFQTKGGHALILRVHFPHESSAGGQLPPAMTLVGVKARHPWLDERMRVTGYPPIESEGQWGASRMRLGAAVNAVVQHLQLNPPSSIRIIDESLQKIQSSIGQPQPDEDQPQPQPQQQQQSSPAHGGPASEPPPDYNTVLQDEEGIDDVLRDIVSFDRRSDPIPAHRFNRSCANLILPPAMPVFLNPPAHHYCNPLFRIGDTGGPVIVPGSRWDD